MNTETRPIGRPPKAEHEKRVASVRADLTLTEKEFIRQQARQAGLTEAAYVRRRALGLPITVPAARVDAALLDRLNRLCLKLSQAGNVANQIARALHTDRQIDSDWHSTADVLAAAGKEARTEMAKIGAAFHD